MSKCLRVGVVAAMLPVLAAAESPSLFGGGTAAPLVPMGEPSHMTPQGAGLFVGQAAGGLFAPWPERAEPAAARAPLDAAPRAGGLGFLRSGPGGGSQIAQLRDLIASVEAGPMGYDAVQHGARSRPSRLPTQMRIREIDAWIVATPGQPHAIGRYQFIPSTLRRLVRELGASPNAMFSPELQDAMAEQLLYQAGMGEFLQGEIGRVEFMNNIARVWAGLPNSSGQSHYHGHAGNRAAMTWAAFEGQMQHIFPESRT